MQVAGKWGTSHYGVRRDGPFGCRNYTIVYAIDCPDISRLKFGRTLKIEKRFAAIRTISPAPVILLGYAWMPDDTEAQIFDFLKADRCHGEWFHRTERVRSVAALLASGKLIELATAIGMEGIVAKDVPSGVSWGIR
jgi:hypothetical protein